jgi:DNA polymerase-1
MQATRKDALRLFHEGSLALAQVENNGIKVDREYLEKATKWVSQREKKIVEELKKDELWGKWQNEYKEQANLTSRPQLAELLFNRLRYPASAFTKGGKPSADEGHLKTVPLPFISKYLQLAKLEKVRGTYLKGIERETDDNGYLHPSFNLVSGDDERGGARSYRGSAQLPNFQNMPLRNKLQGKIIRRAFIPSAGNYLLEVDFNILEVRVNASINLDPTLMSYVSDPTTDMHRDMSEELYILDFKDWEKDQYKDIRYYGKNRFVFPSFYGSSYFQCAPALWKAIDTAKLVTKDGKSLKEHLYEKGIKELGKCDPQGSPQPGTFEYHVYKVEKDFWGRRFPVYDAWRTKQWKLYQSQGYFDLPTGFRIQGIYQKNAVTNYPAQGSAFHILLWCLTELQKWLNKKEMKSKIVAQIHDSMLIDVVPEEFQAVCDACERIMTRKVRQFWGWIAAPLVIEMEASSQNWHDKKPIINRGGVWSTKKGEPI